MSFTGWLELLRELSRLSGSLEFFDFDAPPLGGLLVNIDGYEASSSKLPWMSWSDWGWKAVVASMSDVVASGGKPVAVLYSVGAPSRDVVVEVARGVGDACRWANARVLKADTNRSRLDAWIDVAVAGVTLKPISRSGARPGDLLVQVGLLGYGLVASTALRGLIDIGGYPEAMEYTRRPRINLGVGPKLSECNATAAIDNSDGWAATLQQLSEASKVKIVVEELPATREAVKLIQELNLPEEELLESWEDYNIAVTMPEESVECLLEYCRKENVECHVVGRVESGENVYFKGRRVEPKGWTWFPQTITP